VAQSEPAPPADAPRPPLTLPDVAQLLRVDVRTVKRLVASGEAAVHRPGQAVAPRAARRARRLHARGRPWPSTPERPWQTSWCSCGAILATIGTAREHAAAHGRPRRRPRRAPGRLPD